VKTTRLMLALGTAGVLLLPGCGGSTGTPAASVQQAGAADGGSGDSSQAASGKGSDPTKVDVCALLSPDDAAAVAKAHGLNGSQTDATTYKLTATPQTNTGTPPTSSCSFTISGDGAQGTVVVQVQSAENFSIYASGTKVPGLGDEAYRAQGTTVVRSGGYMLSAGENSFTDGFVVDLYRKMIPHLK
jgi:hypothetical protein